MKCSTCSGEIRKVSMVWAAEQRHGLSGWWFSSSSSVLGERLAPPPPPRIWPTVLAGAIAALAAFVLALHLFWQQGRLSYEQFWWWRLIFFVACGITILGFIRFVVRRDHWNDEYNDWSELWICLACGMVSDHPQDDARPLRAIPRAVSGKLTSKLLMLLVVFFGSVTAAAAQAKIVTIADNVVLTGTGATIDFPAVDVRLLSEVSLLGKTTGIGLHIFVKFSTVPGVYGDSVPAAAANNGGGCILDPVAGVECGTTPLPFKVAGPFMLIRATCLFSPCPAQTFSLDAFMVK